MTFRSALVLVMLALVVGISTGMAVAVARVVEQSAREDLSEALERSRDVVREAWASRRALETAQSRVVAEEPRLKAVVATTDISHSTVVGVAQEINRGLRADVFLISDTEGFLVADATHPDDEGEDLRGLAVVMDALREGSSAGVLADDERVYRVSGQRLAFGNTSVGALVLGNAVDDSFVERIEAQTATALVLALGDRVVVSSTADPRAGAEASRIVEAALSEAPAELEIGGASYLATSFTLEDRADEEPLRAIVLASLDRALEPSRQLIKLLYGLALFALAFGAIVALLLSRRLSGPLDRMVAFAGRVAHGDLEARAEVGGLREIQSLGQALDRMVVDLRASRDAMASKERLEKELEIASRLQTALLPDELKAPGLEIAAKMQTASEVGGDYYDVLPGEGKQAWLAIGDVAGHGLPAGIVMLMVRTAFAALVSRDPSARPKEMITRLNRLIYEGVKGRLHTDEHVTFSAMLHDGNGGFVHAGAHEDILVWRAATGRCERLRTKGAWLGVSLSVDRVTVESQLQLEPGDYMLLMTDGAFESETVSGTMLGVEALIESLEALDMKSATPQRVLDHVFELVSRETVELHDDMTLVVVRRTVAGAGA